MPANGRRDLIRRLKVKRLPINEARVDISKQHSTTQQNTDSGLVAIRQKVAGISEKKLFCVPFNNLNTMAWFSDLRGFLPSQSPRVLRIAV